MLDPGFQVDLGEGNVAVAVVEAHRVHLGVQLDGRQPADPGLVLEQRARERGLPAVELHAQVHAVGFYDRYGYVAFTEVYLEAGIEHRSMRKELA